MTVVNFPSRGECAKKRVTCRIVCESGTIAFGTNDCARPQDVCPRLPGDDYAKCDAVCGQDGHAEEKALRVARLRGFDVAGAFVYIHGVGHICQRCQDALIAARVSYVFLNGSEWQLK